MFRSNEPAKMSPAARRLPQILLDQLIRDGVVKDHAELSRLGHASRSRLTQIVNLLNSAPDIQRAILLLPRVA